MVIIPYRLQPSGRNPVTKRSGSITGQLLRLRNRQRIGSVSPALVRFLWLRDTRLHHLIKYLIERFGEDKIAKRFDFVRNVLGSFIVQNDYSGRVFASDNIINVYCFFENNSISYVIMLYCILVIIYITLH